MTPEDLAEIRSKMADLVQNLKTIERGVWLTREQLDDLVYKMGGGEDDA